MKFPLIKYLLILTVTVGIFLLASCVKEKFSAPNITHVDPAGIHATMTISQFKLAYYLPNQNNPFPFQITDSVILCGVINGDDRSGNIYKTLIFQDSTGGLQVVADKSDLYNDYPVGTRIFVKCKGLYLYNYLGTLELGSYISTTGPQPSLGGIPAVNISTYILKGQTGLTVTPKHWTLFNLTNGADPLNDQSTLIQVDSVQYINADTSLTYADAINKASGNLILEDSLNNRVTVRSSGYANFATSKPPVGFGSVTGIFTIYQLPTSSTNQITIRDTTDVQLTNARRTLQ